MSPSRVHRPQRAPEKPNYFRAIGLAARGADGRQQGARGKHALLSSSVKGTFRTLAPRTVIGLGARCVSTDASENTNRMSRGTIRTADHAFLCEEATINRGLSADYDTRQASTPRSLPNTPTGSSLAGRGKANALAPLHYDCRDHRCTQGRHSRPNMGSSGLRARSARLPRSGTDGNEKAPRQCAGIAPRACRAQRRATFRSHSFCDRVQRQAAGQHQDIVSESAPSSKPSRLGDTACPETLGNKLAGGGRTFDRRNCGYDGDASEYGSAYLSPRQPGLSARCRGNARQRNEFRDSCIGKGAPSNSAFSIKPPQSFEEKGGKWWARLGSNQRPLRCQRSALPLSYAPDNPAAGAPVSRRTGLYRQKPCEARAAQRALVLKVEKSDALDVK